MRKVIAFHQVEESECFNPVTAFGDNAEQFVNVIVLSDD